MRKNASDFYRVRKVLLARLRKGDIKLEYTDGGIVPSADAVKWAEQALTPNHEEYNDWGNKVVVFYEAPRILKHYYNDAYELDIEKLKRHEREYLEAGELVEGGRRHRIW